MFGFIREFYVFDLGKPFESYLCVSSSISVGMKKV